MSQAPRVFGAIDRRFDLHLERAREFLRIPSVSAEGRCLKEAAGLLTRWIEGLGGKVSWAGPQESPVVLGEIPGEGAGTVLLYGMYDVQPAEEPGWEVPPFEAALRDLPELGLCVIARGAFNSKGALAGVFGALEALRESGGIPLTVKMVLEGEEEVGSPSLPMVLEERREALSADWALDFDFGQDDMGRAALRLGVKGLLTVEVLAEGRDTGGPADHAIHAGAAPLLASPAWRLIHGLATLTTPDERPSLEALSPPSPDPPREALLQGLAEKFQPDRFLSRVGAGRLKRSGPLVEVLREALFSPHINIIGFESGYVGPGAKTILPARARALLDVRLMPGMDPGEIEAALRSHLDERGFGDLRLRVLERYPAYVLPPNHPLVKVVLSTYEALGVECILWPISLGSAPYYPFFHCLGVPIVNCGLGHGGRAHAPNEYMTVEGLRALEGFAASLLLRLAGLKGREFFR